MKTKNELGDWQKAVFKMENGISLEDATSTDAVLVYQQQQRMSQRPKTRIVSPGQLRAVRRD